MAGVLPFFFVKNSDTKHTRLIQVLVGSLYELPPASSAALLRVRI